MGRSKPYKAEEDEEQKQARLETIRVFNSVASTDDGVAMFRHLLALCGFEHSDLSVCSNGNGVDALATMYSVGRRNIGVEFMRMIKPAKKARILYGPTAKQRKKETKT